MFERTRIKLTAWYLVIIMAISLLFSMIIYSMVNIEFIRFERMQERIQFDIEQDLSPLEIRPRPEQLSFEDVNEARARLITRLGIMNLGILIFAGGAGFFLAGRTLKPIKDSMDEQNRFISDSSHELRTPLTSLRSEIEVSLMNKNLTLTNAKNVLKSNLVEVISLQNLSDRLLELAEDKEFKYKNLFKEVSILEVINNSINKTSKMASAKNIKVSNKVDERRITGDYDRLVEAFVILLDNAIKYSSKKSNIEVYSKNIKNKVVISIKDEGIGIENDDLTHIFDRFYRAEKSRTEEGYGLGLSIAKKIIEQHKGEIQVKSEVNKGTTFTIILPA
jgi:signal transduction histidine kinase